MRNEESKLQQSCVRWFDLQYSKFSQLLFAIPGGGKRGIITARIMKGEGVRKGIPDFFLSIPKLHYGGMFIELKSEKGYLRPEQKQFFKAVEGNYKCVVIRSVEQFIKEVNEYLN